MKFKSILVILCASLVLVHSLGGIKFRDETEEDYGDEDYGDEEIVCTKDDLCICDIDDIKTLRCDHVYFKNDDDDFDSLETANVRPVKPNVKYQVVILTHNNIKSLRKEKIVPNISESVETLDFSYNQIRMIEARALDDFEHLKVLKLGHNHLTFDVLKNRIFTKTLGEHLDKLHLNHNKLEKIPDGIFDNLGNLKELVLDGNKNLKLTVNTFGKGLENLETLSLDDCNLQELPSNVFDNLIKLNKLSLRGNPLSSIPHAINQIPHLSILDMSGTNLAEMDTDSLHNDHLVEVLIMQDLNYLYAIEDCAFCGLEKLKKIDFSNCSNLYSINKNTFGSVAKLEEIPKMEEISFENCKLTTLDEDLLDWDELKKLSVGGNPFVCDCKLKWLLDDSYYRIFYGEQPMCSIPPNVEKLSFDHMKDIACEEDKVSSWDKMKHLKNFNICTFIFTLVLFVIIIMVIFGTIKCIRKRTCTRKVPQANYDKLPTKPIGMDDGYTYNIQQDV